MAKDALIPRRLVVAVGGNATHPEEIRGTADEQKIVAARTAQSLLPLALLDKCMGPKIEAAVRFLEGGGAHANIAHVEAAIPALRGETGTHSVTSDA